MLCNNHHRHIYFPYYSNYTFMPILLIELDGPSLQINDNLFEGLNVPLIRYQLEQPYIQKVDASKIKQEIKQTLIATSFVNG